MYGSGMDTSTDEIFQYFIPVRKNSKSQRHNSRFKSSLEKISRWKKKAKSLFKKNKSNGSPTSHVQIQSRSLIIKSLRNQMMRKKSNEDKINTNTYIYWDRGVLI